MTKLFANDNFICHNSLLEYAESKWWMTDCLLRCLYNAGASASAICNNQSEMSVTVHDIWKFQTKLRPTEVLGLISAPGISIYNGSLLSYISYISPFASNVSGLIYVDRMIKQHNAFFIA